MANTANYHEFTVEAFADPNSVRDVVRGIINNIFFLRYFPVVIPRTREVAGIDVAYVDEPEVQTLIDSRVDSLIRQLDTERSHSLSSNPHYHHQSSAGGGSGRGQIRIQFLEKQRRKTWFARGEEDVPWESWTVKVTVAEPKTESERAKVRKAMESTLRATIMKTVAIANTHMDHIPPITTNDSNPFPFQIHVGDQKSESGWATRMGIY